MTATHFVDALSELLSAPPVTVDTVDTSAAELYCDRPGSPAAVIAATVTTAVTASVTTVVAAITGQSHSRAGNAVINAPTTTTAVPAAVNATTPAATVTGQPRDPAFIPPARDPPPEAVRVGVRVRPSPPVPTSNPSTPLWALTPHSLTLTRPLRGGPALRHKTFAFDTVFDAFATNDDIFAHLAEPVVDAALAGINGVFFVFGQTGTGKTHTIIGDDKDPGVARRAIDAVFSSTAAAGPEPARAFHFAVKYVEIYQERIRDLLAVGPGADNLCIRDARGLRSGGVGAFVDSREVRVSSAAEAMAVIAQGEAVRAIGATAVNERSSRSHAIFTLNIVSHSAPAGGEDGGGSGGRELVDVRTSSLSLVDLAGSERASQAGAEGTRLVESVHINKSLLALGNVIAKLANDDDPSAHIPYRDSKLTRLLQPALGGNARTAILCAVTLAVEQVEESLSTLMFASRAKKVTNHAHRNEYLDDRAEVRRWIEEAVAVEKGNTVRVEDELEEAREEIERLLGEVERVRDERSAAAIVAARIATGLAGEKAIASQALEASVGEASALKRTIAEAQAVNEACSVAKGILVEEVGYLKDGRSRFAEELADSREEVGKLKGALKNVQNSYAKAAADMRILARQLEVLEIEKEREATAASAVVSTYEAKIVARDEIIAGGRELLFKRDAELTRLRMEADTVCVDTVETTRLLEVIGKEVRRYTGGKPGAGAES